MIRRSAEGRAGWHRGRASRIQRSVAIGKGSRLAEEAQAGTIPAVAMDTFYDSPSRPEKEERAATLRELQMFLPVLRPVSRKWLAKHAHVSHSSGMLRAILNGRKRPGIALAKRLIEIAHAAQQANGDIVQATALLTRRSRIPIVE